MIELEQLETQRIQKLLVRSESEIWIHKGFFYKNMKPNEVEAYQQILPFQKQLLEKADIMVPNFCGQISVPELKELKETYGVAVSSDNLYKISLLRGINHKNIDESYGLGTNYNYDDFKFIFKSLLAFRSIIGPINLVLTEDYESNSMDLLVKSKESIDNFLKINSFPVFEAVYKTGKILENTALTVAHRDLNWNNMSLVRTGGTHNRVLQITDWGSFGMAYAGYDEGRLFTRLCLNSDLQKVYVKSIEDFVGMAVDPKRVKEFLTSFWRTVAIRSYREIYLILNGRYDRLIENRNKKEFINSFEETLRIAVENLTRLLSN